MFLAFRRTILPDRGIAGGMTNDVTYLGISSGASVPPGSDSAETRPTLLLQGRRVAAPAIPTALMNCRLVRITVPFCFAWPRDLLLGHHSLWPNDTTITIKGDVGAS